VKSKVKKLGLFRLGNFILVSVFLLVLLGTSIVYGQIKGPFAETEIEEAQSGATRFINGELKINQGQLIDLNHYFFVGTVYNVQTPQGRRNLISFVTPLTTPTPGQKVEWVGVDNYVSAVTPVYPEEKTMDGEIISLERISAKNNEQFYCVVHSLTDDTVLRFIVDSAKLQSLKTLNSVHVDYRSAGESNVEPVANTRKVAKGFIRDLWLTTKITSLELERDFDFETYPSYITVAPDVNAKYTWTFYLTKEQRAQVKLGNVVEVHYSSVFPSSITIVSQAVDPSALADKPANGVNP